MEWLGNLLAQYQRVAPQQAPQAAPGGVAAAAPRTDVLARKFPRDVSFSMKDAVIGPTFGPAPAEAAPELLLPLPPLKRLNGLKSMAPAPEIRTPSSGGARG